MNKIRQFLVLRLFYYNYSGLKSIKEIQLIEGTVLVLFCNSTVHGKLKYRRMSLFHIEIVLCLIDYDSVSLIFIKRNNSSDRTSTTIKSKSSFSYSYGNNEYVGETGVQSSNEFVLNTPAHF